MNTEPAVAITARRASRQRTAVSAYLTRRTTFASAQEIHAALRESGEPVGLATVYRALQAMVEDGELDALRTDDGETVYRRCGTSHHHHLVCRECGRTVEVEAPDVERWATAVAAQHGFGDVVHTLEIFGVCDRH
ncbi:MAG: transcriptional repressor [Rhodoferax sp.]|nr:transcriptional repressor [Actinomycetota bacterium]